MSRTRHWTRWTAAILLALGLGLLQLASRHESVVAQDKQEKKEAAPTKEPPKSDLGPSVVVEKGWFGLTATLVGTFEPAESAPIVLNPEAWKPDAGGAPLLVRRVVPHGAAVKKGEPLLWLDLERLVETVRDLETGQRLGQLAIQIMERELPILKESVPLELTSVQRSQKEAREDLERFTKDDRSLMEKMADEEVKYSRFQLEFLEEELRQLEKMYKKDDLVEETEKMILRRQLAQISFYKMRLVMEEKSRRDLLEWQLPRQELSLRERLQKLTLEDAKARATLALSAERKQLELEKARQEQDRSGQRLAKLRRDLESLQQIVAPMDGIVYYGRWEEGQWLGYDEAKGQLTPGNPAMPHKVLMTVVAPKSARVTAIVNESDLPHVRPGAKVRIAPKTEPDRKLDGEIQSVTPAPSAPGKFRVQITVAESAGIVPGASADIRVVSYRREGALTLPAEAVQTDELDDDKHFVEIPGDGGKRIRRDVKIGKNNGKRIEILAGLNEGDKVLLPLPKGSK